MVGTWAPPPLLSPAWRWARGSGERRRDASSGWHRMAPGRCNWRDDDASLRRSVAALVARIGPTMRSGDHRASRAARLPLWPHARPAACRAGRDHPRQRPAHTSTASLAELSAREHWLIVEWLPKYAPELSRRIIWPTSPSRTPRRSTTPSMQRLHRSTPSARLRRRTSLRQASIRWSSFEARPSADAAAGGGGRHRVRCHRAAARSGRPCGGS